MVSRTELIGIFKNLNDILRGEGLRAGIERFSEFSNILFLKLMSESGKKQWWNSIKQQNNDDIIGYINGYVINQIKNEYGGDVFTPLLIKNPKTVRSIIEKLDPLILSRIDFDLKGEAFEHFLEQTTSTENDLGEYFTPRHIVKSVVNLVDPKFGETVYDPFCGTGGFLTESFKHIKDCTIIKNAEDERTLKKETIYGREITQNARIAKMNMILQGDGHSGIEQIDTLANPLNKVHDVIITNMPFSQKTEEGWRYENGLAKKNGDATCVLHCLQALKQGGRMALVVPEGFLFRKDIAKVREFLLSKCKLQSVISLPQGTFLPYTGVKTDVLYLTNAHEPNNQKSYWYFDVKNIGYTLDNHRRKIRGKNDLNKLAESDFKRAEKNEDIKENMLEIGFEIVPMEKVKANDYNLVGTRYRETVKSSGKWEMVRLGDLINADLIYAQKGKTITKDTVKNGNIPVIAGGQTSPYSHNKSTHDGNIITMSASGAYSGFIWYHDYPIWASDCSVFYSKDETKLLTKYLYHMLKHQQDKIYAMQNGAGQPHVYIRDVETLYIPLPPISEQQKLVDELDKIQTSIQSAKDLIESLKAQRGGDCLFFMGMKIGNLLNWARFVKHHLAEHQKQITQIIITAIFYGFNLVKCAKKIYTNLKKPLQNLGLKTLLQKYFPKIQFLWRCMVLLLGKLAF